MASAYDVIFVVIGPPHNILSAQLCIQTQSSSDQLRLCEISYHLMRPEHPERNLPTFTYFPIVLGIVTPT